MTEDPRRRRFGALVAAGLLLASGFGPIAALSGSFPSGPRPETLFQVSPASPTTASTGAADVLASDAAPVGGVATTAEAPPADATAVAAAGGSSPRPGASSGTNARVPGTIEERGAAALALISYPWTRTGYSIVFTGPHVGLLGLTESARKQMTIYVRPGQPIRDIAWVIGHEVAHAVDFTMTTDAERAEYRRIRGLDSRPWYPTCENCSDFASPIGDWAETFAFWLLGEGPFASQLAPRPTAAQLAALTPLFTPDPEPAPTTTTTRPSTAKKPPPTAVTTTTTAPKPIRPQWVPSTRPRPRPRPAPTTTTTRPRTPTTTTTRPTTTTTRPTTTTTRPTTTTTRPTTTSTRPTTTSTRPTTSTTGPTTTTRPTTTTTGPTTTTRPTTTTTGPATTTTHPADTPPTTNNSGRS